MNGFRFFLKEISALVCVVSTIIWPFNEHFVAELKLQVSALELCVSSAISMELVFFLVERNNWNALKVLQLNGIAIHITFLTSLISSLRLIWRNVKLFDLRVFLTLSCKHDFTRKDNVFEDVEDCIKECVTTLYFMFAL